MVDIHGHRYEVYTLVSEIHINVDLVLGIKNTFELERVINLWDFFKFLNRSLPIFPKEGRVWNPKEQKLIKVNALFRDEIPGLVIVKILDGNMHSTMLLKLKFMQNATTLDMANDGLDTIIFKPEEMIGILDPRSLGYYKIKQGILQQNLSKNYRFERADALCEHLTSS